MAWFARSSRGLKSLRSERAVLRLLASRCTFRAPRVLLEAADGGFDVREMVPGECEPARIWNEVCSSPTLALRVGTDVGKILAEQHSRVQENDLSGLVPDRPPWPPAIDDVLDGLSRVRDSWASGSAPTIMAEYERVSGSAKSRALVHTDVGFHNLAVDPETRSINGLFDYGDAAWADPHHDFRYLVLDIDQWELLDGATASYRAETGVPVFRERVLLYNAACALGYLAYGDRKAPEDRSCGRTLSEDIEWSRLAVRRVLGPHAAAELERFLRLSGG